MANSLKDALEKAGLKSSGPKNEHPRKPKKPKSSGKPKKAIEKHQQQRNFCECCKKVAPDVELYKHNNRSLQAKWLCIVCADEYLIPDDVRQSNQSDFARRGTFRRRYGRTKKFVKEGQSEFRGNGNRR